jgi:aminopeptidase N
MRLFRRLSPQEIPSIIRGVTFDVNATTLLATPNQAAEAAARAVAAGLFGKDPTVVSGDPQPSKPVLVVGTTPDVSALLQKLGVEGPPASLADKGTARAWAASRPDGAPLVVVAGNDAAALRAAAGPLPHYGRQSYVVLDGAKVIDRGLWEPAANPLRVELAQ